jgi:putative glutamine amidotransferase
LASDGVIVAGGGDVAPAHYGEAADVDLLDLDPARDQAELAAIAAAVEQGLPVLGICRGAQALAVALGGALHQDLKGAGFVSHWFEDQQHEPVHAIHADVCSVASRALAGAATVNSIHHQAVRDPGPDLVATAWSDDGVIEAVEGDGLLGVQWHPERLFATDARHMAPFQWLVAA